MLLYERGSLSLKEITASLQLPASTCYNLVTTLESRGVIKKDTVTNLFSLGITLVKWGFKAHDDIDIRKVANVYLHRLVDTFDETATVTIFNRPSFESVVIDVIEGNQILRTSPRIGAKYPVHATGGGKCFLSSLSQSEIEHFFQQHPTLNGALRSELQKIKEAGYAVTINELGNNAASVGAGIYNNFGEMIAALGLSGPEDRMIEKMSVMTETVKKYASEISTHLQGMNESL